MILKRLRIRRLPGIEQPFEIQFPGPGFHIIYGPNGIGKSSVCRAVTSLYWSDRGPSERVSIDGQFETEDEVWRASREGPRLQWHCDDDSIAAPILPQSHNDHCFILRLRDLIDPSHDGTRDVASEIKRQMSGGFDLQDIVDAQFPRISRQYGRPQRRAFNSAEKSVQVEVGRQAGLQRDADRLNELQEQLVQANADHEQIRYVDEAINLVVNKAKCEEFEEEISNMPASLANLMGNELEEVTEFQLRVDEYDSRILDLRSRIDTALVERQQSQLAEPIDKTVLSAWNTKADELYRIEVQLRDEKVNEAEYQNRFQSSLKALGSVEAENFSTTIDDHNRLFSLLRASDTLRNERSAIEEERRVIDSFEQSREGETDRDVLRAAIDCLRLWLRSPESPNSPEKLMYLQKDKLISVILAIVLVVGFALYDPFMGVALAAGYLFVYLVSLIFKKNVDVRADAERAFSKFHIDEPTKWIAESVEMRLGELEKEFTEVDTRMQRDYIRGTERKKLESKLADLAVREARLAERREILLESLQLNSIEDAELVDLVRALDEVRKVKIELEGSTKRVEQTESMYIEKFAELNAFLQGLDEPLPDKAAEAKASLNSLLVRNTKLEQAIRDEDQAVSQLKQTLADRQSAVDSINGIYERAAIKNGDIYGLEQLLGQQQRYLDLVNETNQIKRDIDRGKMELKESELSDTLVNCARSQLDELKQKLIDSSSTADGKRDEIAEINARVSETKRSSSLQTLIEEREQARSELKDRRDHAMFNTAGRFLVEEVDRVYSRSQIPRVFERASELFSAFTHFGYRLELGHRTESPRLYATDIRAGESRELDELSDGTRAQLLLAARMAFAEEVEQGGRLPLFLDEALDQSDPRRFEAIARSLARVAEDQGRQIIYLTSDPSDIVRISNAIAKEESKIVAEIDLGEIRTGASSITNPTILELEPRIKIPTPNGATMEEYAKEIGVTPLNPAHGYNKQDFFYILFDDLDLLYKLRSVGIDRIGQWSEKSVADMTESLASDSDTLQQIDTRVNLFGIFCELWSQGRSRTIDRDVLANSKAVSEVYLDNFAAIVIENDNDPQALLYTIKERTDDRTRGFLARNIERLEEYLVDSGYIDHRVALEESEVTFKALATLADADSFLEDAKDCLSRWWGWAEKAAANS